jgi:hypothetical protein
MGFGLLRNLPEGTLQRIKERRTGAPALQELIPVHPGFCFVDDILNILLFPLLGGTPQGNTEGNGRSHSL